MNYLTYNRRPGDVKFRIVSLRSSNMKQFADFDGDKVTYPAENAVVEVMDSQGNCHVRYDQEPVPITIHREADKIFFSDRIPKERLWVRFKDGTGIAYKVPNKLMVREGHAYLLIPGGANKVELFGDKYLSAAFELRDR